MLKAEIFDINTAKADQLTAEMLLTADQRMMLCLDLMELNISLAKNNEHQVQDGIEWIELSFKQ